MLGEGINPKPSAIVVVLTTMTSIILTFAIIVVITVSLTVIFSA